MNKRNYGIDLLRIVSILGVVFLHVLGHGGILAATKNETQFATAWFLEILAYPAVNCFVLISGYFGFREDRIFPRLKNIISLLFTVFFYSILIYFAVKRFRPDLIGEAEAIKAFRPVSREQYWFFTAYFGMFLLSPVLNAFVQKSDKKGALIMLFTLFFMSIFTLKSDAFSFSQGYTVIWFVLIYLAGAIFKKFDLTNLFSGKIWVMIGFVALLVTWTFKTVLPADLLFAGKNRDIFVSYTSPTVVLMSLCWLSAFSKINCNKFFASVINFFAPSVFSVYLIHDNANIRKWLITDTFRPVCERGSIFIILLVFGSALAIFISCILIDKIRFLLFRVVKIEKLSEKLESLLKTIINLACTILH